MEDGRNLQVKREIRTLVKMSLQILCGFLKKILSLSVGLLPYLAANYVSKFWMILVPLFFFSFSFFHVILGKCTCTKMSLTLTRLFYDLYSC